jgi:hypothetical protein
MALADAAQQQQQQARVGLAASSSGSAAASGEDLQVGVWQRVLAAQVWAF